MDVNFNSTYVLNARLRNSVQTMQGELSQRQVELTSGKKYDAGLELGSLTSHLVAARRQLQSAEQIKTTNGMLTNRMSVMQAGMGSMVSSAQDLIDQITVELGTSLDRGIVAGLGTNGIADFAAMMNTSYQGQYVFSGLNSDAPAFASYIDDPQSTAQAAVQTAFATHFGFSANDAQAASISAEEMTAFLEGAYSDLFDDANWSSLWSGSSERGMRVKISLSEVAEIPVTGNDTAFRELAAGFAAMAEFSGSQLDASAFNAVVNFSIGRLNTGVDSTIASQARLGVVEQRVERSTERIDYQSTILQQGIADLEQADSYETAMRINELLASIEASYAVTSQIQGLSIMNYI